MILPKDIKSRHKIRDAQILDLYSHADITTALIGQKFGISQPRVIQIVKANAELVLREKDWNKLQRLNLIKSEIKRPEFQEQVLSKRDALDLWRKEFEADGIINTIQNFLQINLPDSSANRLNQSKT